MLTPAKKQHIDWVIPFPSNSHHQDYYMFSRGFEPNPSFATIAGKGCPTQDIHPYQYFVVTGYFIGAMISMLVMSIDH